VCACLALADSLPVAAVLCLAADSFNGGQELGVGAVHQWGLFPASALSTPVLLFTVDSIAGLGIRPLSWPELAALWDVPILISDHLSEASGVNLLWGFLLVGSHEGFVRGHRRSFDCVVPGGFYEGFYFFFRFECG